MSEQSIIPPAGEKTTKPRPRKAFAHARATVDGVTYSFTMHRDGLTVRRRHSRKPVCLSFVTLLDRVRQQFELPLQEPLPLRKGAK